MTLIGEQILLRVYLRNGDRAPHVPTSELLVKSARQHNLAGATVLQGILGFGSRGVLRPANWSPSSQFPLIVEIVDRAERIGEFLAGPMARLMIGGMATLERAHVMLDRQRGREEPAALAVAGELAPRSTLPNINVGGRMNVKDNAILLRVFIGESRAASGPLYEAIVQTARELGLAGATVLRGTEGFGASSVVHKASLLEMSADLPVVIEIVDAEPKIRLLLPRLEKMVTEGMVTMEHVQVLIYRHDPQDSPPGLS